MCTVSPARAPTPVTLGRRDGRRLAVPRSVRRVGHAFVVLTPLALRFALWRGVVDKPGGRKTHADPVPTSAGSRSSPRSRSRSPSRRSCARRWRVAASSSSSSASRSCSRSSACSTTSAASARQSALDRRGRRRPHPLRGRRGCPPVRPGCHRCRGHGRCGWSASRTRSTSSTTWTGCRRVSRRSRPVRSS